MLKKKICQLLAAVMVATTVLGTNVQAVGATVVDSQVASVSGKVADGTYMVANKTLKVDKEDESSIRGYIDTESVITVEGDKTIVTMKYNEEGLETVKSTNSVTIDGEEVPFTVNEDGSISFEVKSIELVNTRIRISLTYYNEFIPEFIAPGHMHTVDIDLLHDWDLVNGEGGSSNEPGNNGGVETPDDDNSENTPGEETQVLEDGNYTLNNAVYKLGTTQESMARGFIEDKTNVTVKDGKITMTFKYKGIGLTSIRNTNIKVNGIETASTVNEDKSVSFEVPSIDAKIEVEMDINVESMGFTEVQSVDFVNDKDSLVKVDDTNSGDDSENNGGNTGNPGDGNNGGNTGNEGSNNGGSNNGTTEEQGTKVYTGKLEVTHESATGLSMAKKALEETLKVEDINGNKYVTLTFTAMGSTLMNNHEIYVNGNKVDATKTLNGEIVSLRFKVGSLEDSIKVSAYVTMMGSNVEFGVNVLEDTLTLVTDGETNNGATNNGGTTGGSISNDTTNNGTSGNTTTTEEETKVTKGKLYSIQNSVTHESETGRAMARKYLNSTSKVEEVDGKYYVTLTFTGSEFMQNHVIYVNGKKVDITKNTSGDTTNIRFAVSSLSDSITVKTYVVPMDKEVEFGVTLLEDTLTFIKEYTVDTLPQTGAPIGSGAIAGLGLILTSAGTVLLKKRK